MRIQWLEPHIEALLDSLLAQKAGFGQGGNPQGKHLQAACDAVNEKFGDTQNMVKALRSVQDKWRTVCANICAYICTLIPEIAQGYLCRPESLGRTQRPQLRQ